MSYILIKRKGGKIVTAGEIADSFRDRGTIQKNVLDFAVDYLAISKAEQRTKCFGPNIGLSSQN